MGDATTVEAPAAVDGGTDDALAADPGGLDDVPDAADGAAEPEPDEVADDQGDAAASSADASAAAAAQADEPVAGSHPDHVAPNDLAARAAARGKQVAREGMPQPTTHRPDGPAVERDLPPDPDEVAQLEVIQSRWAAVLELVRADNVKAEAMLDKAKPTRLRRRVLCLSYPQSHSFHARSVASQEFDSVLVPAIERNCDVAVRIEVEIDGVPVGGGGPKPAEPATGTSPAALAAARAAGTTGDGASPATSATTDGDHASSSSVGGSSSSRRATEDGGSSTPVERNPMADLDPATAMDRAAASLVDQLGATEVEPDTPAH